MTAFDDYSLKFRRPKTVSGLAFKPAECHEVTITTADLDAEAMTDTVSLGTDDSGNAFPANARILGVDVVVDVPFSGGSAMSVTIDVGDAGNTDEWVDAEDVFGASAGDVLYDGGDGVGGAFGQLEASAYAGIATFTSDVNVDDLTAGQCRVRIWYLRFGYDPAAA